MAFDLSSAKPMSSGGFDLSSAKPVDAIPAQRKTQDTNAAVAFTAGLGTGVGTVALTVQDLVGRGLKVLGADGAGNWLVEDAKKGKFKLSQEVKPYEETSPTATSAGKFTGEVAATLPVGGVIAAPIKAASKVAPALKPIATAVESSGFQTGLKPGVANALTRAGGGAITGAAASGLIDPDSMPVGAVIGAAMPTLGSATVNALVRSGGWVYDAMTGQLSKIAAGKLYRRAAGENVGAIRAANAAAPEGVTAGQAAADINSPTFQALAKMAERNDPNGYYYALNKLQGQAQVDEIARLAGGRTQAETRATRESSKNALNQITTPMRENELAAANTGALKQQLEGEANRLAGAAADKVEDVRRFSEASERLSRSGATRKATETGMPTPNKYTLEGEMAQAAERVATDSAEASLLYGQGARFAQQRADSLAAYGLEPLDTTALTNDIAAKLDNPTSGVRDVTRRALIAVNRKIEEWTAKNGGVIDAQALYEIRKDTVNDVIERFMGNADPSAKQKAAAQTLAKVRPLIDNAIEKAGGTGWRDYLRTFEAGMKSIEQKKLADVALAEYNKSPEAFIKLIRGDNVKAVEKVFGPGNYDLVKELGPKIIPLQKVQVELERGINMTAQAKAGEEALARILREDKPGFRFPALFSAKITFANKGLDVLESKINKKTMDVIIEGMKSGKNANEILGAIPFSDRQKVLKSLKDVRGWSTTITTPAARGASSLGADSKNNLAPENQNNLRND
jgi:hypothetical protein